MIRLIRERWEKDEVQSTEQQAEIAADEILTRTWINNPNRYEFGDATKEAIDALFSAQVEHSASPQDHIDQFRELSEFDAAKKTLAGYFTSHKEGLDTAITHVVFRPGTGCYGYELDHDPIEKIKSERHFGNAIEIAPTDIDRFS